MRWIRALFCKLGRCTRCQTISTDEGIGGQCLDCGKMHGWVTRDELRAYADRMSKKTTPDFIYD